MNRYYIEFFETVFDIKNKDYVKLTKVLLKLNNPTYYSKFIVKNPIEKYGFTSKIIKDPILLAITSMLSILNDKKLIDSDKQRKLESEYSWAYNNVQKLL